MKEFTNEIIDQIDDNNMKAREILRMMMCMVGSEEINCKWCECFGC